MLAISVDSYPAAFLFIILAIAALKAIKELCVFLVMVLMPRRNVVARFVGTSVAFAIVAECLWMLWRAVTDRPFNILTAGVMLIVTGYIGSNTLITAFVCLMAWDDEASVRQPQRTSHSTSVVISIVGWVWLALGVMFCLPLVFGRGALLQIALGALYLGIRTHALET